MEQRQNQTPGGEKNPRMLERIVEKPRAWRNADLSEADWLLPIPTGCLAEIEAVVAALRKHPLPTLLLKPEQFKLEGCARLMEDTRRRLDEGCGVVVLDRLPMGDYTLAEVTDVFWLLGTLLARPVAQTIDGQIMVDITDTGVEKAIGVRGFRTRVGQPAHIDNSFNHAPPDYVSLCSIRKSREGGVSKFISFYTVHNEMMRKAPELLPRLYQPFFQDRQGDFHPGESQTVSYPLFAYDTELRSRFTHFTVPAGYQTAGAPFEGETKAAFEAMAEIVEDPSLYCSFTIKPGQLQFVNNRGFGHGRTGYEDVEDPALKRLLLRLWHRDRGRQTYNG